MFAARDQENLIHTHQTTAASKPLNNGIRGLQPKTPGNLKTPFRPAKNDENRPLELKGQKTTLKDGPSKLDKNAFITPLEPRTRAPLGIKTGNTKAQPFKTPAPLQLTAKPGRTLQKPSTGRRSAKSKITIASSEPVQADVPKQDDDDEPDFGYAPPPITALPDDPMEFPYDQTFPQFQGKNMFRGYEEVYCTTPTDENGISLRLKREEEMYRKFTEEQERLASKEPDLPSLPTDEELEAQVEAMILAGPRNKLAQSNVDTVKAKSAAALLSPQSTRLPAVATKQTKASEQKRKDSSRPDNIHNSTARSTPALVSKNTIGFPKAKKAPSIVPKADQLQQKSMSTSKEIKINQSQIHPKDFVRLYGEPPVESQMWLRLREYELLEESLNLDGEPEDDLFDIEDLRFGIEEDNDDVFQLPMPK